MADNEDELSSFSSDNEVNEDGVIDDQEFTIDAKEAYRREFCEPFYNRCPKCWVCGSIGHEDEHMWLYGKTVYKTAVCSSCLYENTICDYCEKVFDKNKCFTVVNDSKDDKHICYKCIEKTDGQSLPHDCDKCNRRFKSKRHVNSMIRSPNGSKHGFCHHCYDNIKATHL